MPRITPSEAAAAAWIVGGIVATVALQAATDGEHSVSDGLRAHPAVTSLLGVGFACHLARWPAWFVHVDPFHACGWAIHHRGKAS